MTKVKQAKYLAYSSRLAFVFKAGMSLLICSVLAIIARDAKNAFAVYFLLFPLIGLLTDSILYLRRGKIFKADVNDEDIPETYGLNAEELVTYAKKIPLVRLLRIIPAILMIPLGLFSISDSLLIVCIVSVLMGYYPAALADAYFAKRLGIKLPSTYKIVFDPITSFIPYNSSLNMAGNFAEQSGILGFRKPIYESLNYSLTPISSTLSNHT